MITKYRLGLLVAVFATAATAVTFAVCGQAVGASIFGVGAAADALVAIRFWNKPNVAKPKDESYPRKPLAWS
jgi:hypothetical protein